MAAIERITYKTVVRPMRTTFATARGSKTCATSIIVQVLCDDGSTGIGEVPTSFVVPQETVEVIKRSIRRSAKWLTGQGIDQWTALATTLRGIFPNFQMTCSGLETAMFRAYLRSKNLDEKTWWGRKKTNTIKSDITIPFVPNIETLKPWIQRAVRKGFDTYKIKVSGNINTDTKFTHSIAEMLKTAKRPYAIRLDGNQGFTCNSAMHLLDRLKVDIELFEQPLKHDDFKGMKKLTAQSSVPIIADETVFSVEDARRVIEDNLAHGINIKIAKSGVRQSKEIIKLAKKAKLKLMIGCMTETMVGLSTAIYCAAGTGAFDCIDLDSVHFLYARNHHQDITIDGPVYHLGERP
ncbi:MAG: enolase C-terminal domain-like protein [Planctomycetota bacterium]|jgi:L-alanine-DL-glutamate epimerase-like enolase superfamily enzyme